MYPFFFLLYHIFFQESYSILQTLLSLLLFLQTDRLLFLFFLHAYNTLLPFAVNLNLAPSTSAAFLHIIILREKFQNIHTLYKSPRQSVNSMRSDASAHSLLQPHLSLHNSHGRAYQNLLFLYFLHDFS